MPSWFENVYAAQTCWDTIMAESMRRKLAEKEYHGYKGVIIAGSFHVVYGLGIPFRYAKADRRDRITTIVPVYIAEPADENEEEHPMMKAMGKNLPRVAVFSRGIADYVVAFAPQEVQHFPTFGIKGKMRDGGFVLSEVKKQGLGEKFGLHQDDVILKINGVAVSSLETFRHLLSKINWDESLEMTVKKKVEVKK
jgi:C-terminal processing protease CtpA/Prc